MLIRFVLFAVAVFSLLTSGLFAQILGTVSNGRSDALHWRRPGERSSLNLGVRPRGFRPNNFRTAQTGTTSVPLKVSEGSGTLPHDHNQVWREYDISPYTRRYPAADKTHLALRDWVLRETGTEVWSSEVASLISVDQNTLKVYHTPEIQQIVYDTVERFVTSTTASQTFGIRLITIGNPAWRSKANRLLRPVSSRTPGVQAWLLSREDAALLSAELAKRFDYRQHNTPNLLIHNGQSETITRMRPRNYIRSVERKPNIWPGFEQEMGHLEEGYSLQVSPLLSSDGRSGDAVIKFNVDQVERLVKEWIDMPSAVAPRQRVKIEVPQMSNWRLHERFNWPIDQVLLISCGVIASPEPGSSPALGIPLPWSTSPRRVEVLLFVESKGKSEQYPRSANSRTRSGPMNYRNRY